MAGVDAVEEGLSWVVVGDPGAVGVGDLVVGPGEGAPLGPLDEGAGFPVEPVSFVLVVGVGGFGPGDYGELGEAEEGGDAFVGVGGPGCCPHELA